MRSLSFIDVLHDGFASFVNKQEPAHPGHVLLLCFVHTFLGHVFKAIFSPDCDVTGFFFSPKITSCLGSRRVWSHHKGSTTGFHGSGAGVEKSQVEAEAAGLSLSQLSVTPHS